ncbi:MAG TPA: hypothetical protein VJ760_04255, partial [Nitrospiraceae bacterium]|nr:hypothetical protein [Nitrospiraceae bacterium]
MGGVAWPSSCSRNAHDKNVLVRRAQSRIDQATLESEIEDWKSASLGEESVLADSGRVRSLALSSILRSVLLLCHVWA